MTRPQIKLYWYYMNRRKARELERQATAVWGYDPKAKEKQKQQRELAEKWQKDPLYLFPNDIIYFTKEQIGQKMGVSRRFWNKIKPESRWEEERGRACMGRKGQVAKRCSMNDKLWSIYLDASKKGISLTLTQIRKMILIDIKRSQLYPPGWTDDTASPPEWHLDKLRSEGKLEGIFREIDEATKG